MKRKFIFSLLKQGIMRYFLPVFAIFLFSCGNTLYVVRHAEKAKPLAGMSAMEANDPPLSDSGKLRAIQLKDELKHAHIQYIFSTNYKRTIATAQPLNELRGSTHIQIYSPQKDSTDAFIQRLKSIKKGNVLIVGHSNTVDDIANKLCDAIVVPGDLKDNQYDNLFEIKRKGSSYKFKGKKYGYPSNPEK